MRKAPSLSPATIKPDSAPFGRWSLLAKSQRSVGDLHGHHEAAKIGAQLIAHGRDSDTPVTVISRGTRDDQQTITGTLQQLRTRRKTPRCPPAGGGGEVNLRHHQQLAWFQHTSSAEGLTLRWSIWLKNGCRTTKNDSLTCGNWRRKASILFVVAAEFSQPGNDVLHRERFQRNAASGAQSVLSGTCRSRCCAVDTGWKFREMYEFRDRTAKAYGCELLVHKKPGRGGDGHQPVCPRRRQAYTDIMKTEGAEAGAEQIRLLTPRSAYAHVATKRHPARKSASTPRPLPLGRKIASELWHNYNGQINKAKASASSRSPTGWGWISGGTSIWKNIEIVAAVSGR